MPESDAPWRSGRRGDDAAVLRVFIVEEELHKTSHLADELRAQLVQSIAMVQLLLARWCEPPAAAAPLLDAGAADPLRDRPARRRDRSRPLPCTLATEAQVLEFLQQYSVETFAGRVELSSAVDLKSVTIVDRLEKGEREWIVKCTVAFDKLEYRPIGPSGQLRDTAKALIAWLESEPQFRVERYETGWKVTGAL